MEAESNEFKETIRETIAERAGENFFEDIYQEVLTKSQKKILKGRNYDHGKCRT